MCFISIPVYNVTVIGSRTYLFIIFYYFLFFVIVNNNIVLYINTFHTETGPLCQTLRSFTNL